MFSDCSMLQTVDISSFTIETLIDTSFMFYNCSDLQCIYCKANTD